MQVVPDVGEFNGRFSVVSVRESVTSLRTPH